MYFVFVLCIWEFWSKLNEVVWRKFNEIFLSESAYWINTSSLKSSTSKLLIWELDWMMMFDLLLVGMYMWWMIGIFVLICVIILVMWWEEWRRDLLFFVLMSIMTALDVAIVLSCLMVLKLFNVIVFCVVLVGNGVLILLVLMRVMVFFNGVVWRRLVGTITS